jgi:hypothetical protein
MYWKTVFEDSADSFDGKPGSTARGKNQVRINNTKMGGEIVYTPLSFTTLGWYPVLVLDS